MKLVSSQSQDDIRRATSLERIKVRLRGMLANMLRVQRGAGRPYSIFNDIVDTAIALSDHYREFGDIGEAFFSNSIDLDVCFAERVGGEERVRQINLAKSDFDLGQDIMVRGAMQIIASQLLGQMTQESAGDKELFQGFEMVERERAKNRGRRNG